MVNYVPGARFWDSTKSGRWDRGGNHTDRISAKIFSHAMTARPINDIGDVYQFVGDLRAVAARRGMTALPTQLESALKLGSSALEILGAIREILINNNEQVGRLLGPDGEAQAKQVIAFVDKSFGR